VAIDAGESRGCEIVDRSGGLGRAEIGVVEHLPAKTEKARGNDSLIWPHRDGPILLRCDTPGLL